MPIQRPDLDDLRYERLRELLISRIPVHTPEWTDHNASDPGIAMLELFAWMTEQVGYRFNQVSDRNYIAFLELLGVRLSPAQAASSRLALVMVKPETLKAFRVPAGSLATADTAEAPEFEVDTEIAAVPAQLAVVVSTRSTDLRDISIDALPLADDDDPEAWLQDNMALVWDGKTPKLEEMCAQPLPLGQVDQDASHQRLWLGFVFNPAGPAGFLGQRVTLSVQLDDDEQPDTFAQVRCGDAVAISELAGAQYHYYRPRQAGETTGRWVTLRTLSDTTDAWARSGEIRFDVPRRMGPIPDTEWQAPRAPTVLTMEEICEAATASPDTPLPEPVEHPLPGSLPTSVVGLPLVVPVSGWIAVSFPGGSVPAVSLRQVSFNVVEVTQAASVISELMGTGNGEPGQVLRLAHGNVLDQTLELAVTDLSDGLLHTWERVEDLDASEPDAKVFTLDREAGEVIFGDGNRGRPPQIGARIIALSYRHGGGQGADLPPGVITKVTRMPSEVSAVSNMVSALGGKDAETLEQAKIRAPQELEVLGRAVTSSDYRFLTLQAPGLRVARAEVVPLRRPYAEPARTGPGLDLRRRAAGALSVVVVPDEVGLYPRPTAGMLQSVCRWLDQHRLITTEVHVVPPMYVRLYDVEVTVVAEPGYSSVLLRESIAAELETWLHVLSGGEEGEGTPFGALLSHSAVLARLFAVEGVARIERLSAMLDCRAPAAEGEEGEQLGRDERLTAQRLTNCPELESDVDRISLAEDEVPFVDTSTLLVSVSS
ncbi:MAG: putative phage baseplate assembly protein [Cognaticolwellia sp.]